MNHRHIALIDNLAVPAATVQIFNLKGMDCISELILVFRGAQLNVPAVGPHADWLSRFQVVDGSEVIVDLTGRQCVALGYYHYGIMPPNMAQFTPTLVARQTFRIPFGRWLWDQELALDPQRFKNLQVILTLTPALGGKGTVAGFCDLIGNMFDQKKINPRGYLRAREHFRYTVVNGAIQRVDLPTDKVIKMLMFQGDQNAVPMTQTMSRLKIDEDNDKHIYIDNDMTEIVRDLSPTNEPINEPFYVDSCLVAQTIFNSPFYAPLGVAGGIDAIRNYCECTSLDGGQMRVWAIAAGNLVGHAQGYCPYAVIGLSLGDGWDIDDWYNPSGIKQLQARITSGAAGAGGTNKVIIQQLFNY
jgi:hypothetical protein